MSNLPDSATFGLLVVTLLIVLSATFIAPTLLITRDRTKRNALVAVCTLLTAYAGTLAAVYAVGADFAYFASLCWGPLTGCILLAIALRVFIVSLPCRQQAYIPGALPGRSELLYTPALQAL